MLNLPSVNDPEKINIYLKKGLERQCIDQVWNAIFIVYDDYEYNIHQYQMTSLLTHLFYMNLFEFVGMPSTCLIFAYLLTGMEWLHKF